MNFSFILVILSHVPIALVCIYAFISRDHFSKSIRGFSYFLYLNAIVQISALILGFFEINNLPLLHLLVPAGCCFLLAFYEGILNGFIDRRIFIITGILFVIFSLINSIFYQPLFSFNSNALTVESILLVILAISTYLFFVMESGAGIWPQRSSGHTWINSGLFVYHASSLIIFYLSQTIFEKQSREFMLYTWVIHAILSIIMYICFFIGLWKQPKN